MSDLFIKTFKNFKKKIEFDFSWFLDFCIQDKEGIEFCQTESNPSWTRRTKPYVFSLILCWKGIS